MKKRILVIDVGGSNVKVMISRAQKRKFKSGPDLTPREMMTQMKPLLRDWSFDAVSMGFPAPVRNGRIMSEPKHLGPGWTRFDYEKSLGKPIRIINDAAMQALGSLRCARQRAGHDQIGSHLETCEKFRHIAHFFFTEIGERTLIIRFFPIGPIGLTMAKEIKLHVDLYALLHDPPLHSVCPRVDLPKSNATKKSVSVMS